jgi:hypothetical protein
MTDGGHGRATEFMGKELLPHELKIHADGVEAFSVCVFDLGGISSELV